MGRNSGTQARRLPRYAPWAVPVAVVTAAGLVIAGSVLASAQAAPVLPHRSAAALLADAIAARPPSALSGTVTEDASLGLPQLPQSDFGGGVPGYSLLAGSHSFSFWSDGPGRLRIAVPVQLGETDLRQDGRQIWLWNSSTNTATHIVPSAGVALPAGWTGTTSAAGWTRSWRARPDHSLLPEVSGVTGMLNRAGPTPLQAARSLLAAVGPTSTVSVQSNVMVAGQAAYQLALAPKTSGSLIGQIRIAIDARGYLPLRLEVFARGATSPAYQVGFTSLSFARPAASNFSFTPPPGAKVKTITVPRLGPGLLGGLAGVRPVVPGPLIRLCGRPVNVRSKQVKVSGAPVQALPRIVHCRLGMRASLSPASGTVRIAPVLPARLRRQLHAALAHGSPAQRAAAFRKLRQALQAQIAAHPANGGGFINVHTPSPAGGPQVIGTGWLAVLVLHSAGAVAPMLGAQPVPAPPPGPPGASSSVQVQVPGSVSSSAGGSSVVISTKVASPAPAAVNPPSLTVAGPAAPLPPLLRLVLRAAQPVHGSWGSGRLIRTSLLSVLLTSDGRVLIGAVTPAVLYAAAAKAK